MCYADIIMIDGGTALSSRSLLPFCIYKVFISEEGAVCTWQDEEGATEIKRKEKRAKQRAVRKALPTASR